MKLNVECMRDVLMELEQASYNESVRIQYLHEKLSEYSQDEIDYTIIKLEEAGFVDAVIANYNNGKIVLVIDDITYAGHQFLANIQETKIWEKVKKTAADVGSFSVNTLSQIASAVVAQMISNQMM